MENILFNTNKNHSTNQIDVYNTERAFAARSSSFDSIYILKVCAIFLCSQIIYKSFYNFFAKMLTNNMVGAILIYERC